MPFLEDVAGSLNLTSKQLLAAVGFIFLIACIPLTSIMLKESQIFKSQAAEKKPEIKQTITTTKNTNPTPSPKNIPATSPLSELAKLLEITPSPQASTPPLSEEQVDPDLSPTPTINLAFGPTLTTKISIEGRPKDKQAAKVFIGISTGSTALNPTYVLTFTVDFPASGTFSGLSLAGLNHGSTYTAYLKGPGQIDSSSTFTMSPTESTLNSGQAITLTSGDLNDDNTINTLDYTVSKNLLQTTSSSTNWNERADFNLDGIINSIDLAYIIKNMGKTGTSGVWFSPVPTSTPSAGLSTTPAVGGYNQ